MAKIVNTKKDKLINVRKELAFQIEENGKLAIELIIVRKELAFQNKEERKTGRRIRYC